MTLKRLHDAVHDHEKWREWALLLGVVCAMVAVGALIVGAQRAEDRQCRLLWLSVGGESYHYADLLQQYDVRSTEPARVWWSAFYVLNMVGLGLAVYSRHWSGAGILALMQFTVGGFVWAMVSLAPTLNGLCPDSHLFHEHTMTFDGQVYHVALQTNASFDVTPYVVTLFVCDAEGDLCQVVHQEFVSECCAEAPDSSLMVDRETHTLRLFVEGRLVHTVESGSGPD